MGEKEKETDPKEKPTAYVKWKEDAHQVTRREKLDRGSPRGPERGDWKKCEVRVWGEKKQKQGSRGETVVQGKNRRTTQEG